MQNAYVGAWVMGERKDSLERCTEFAENIFVPSSYRYVSIFFPTNNTIPYDNVVASLVKTIVNQKFSKGKTRGLIVI